MNYLVSRCGDDPEKHITVVSVSDEFVKTLLLHLNTATRCPQT